MRIEDYPDLFDDDDVKVVPADPEQPNPMRDLIIGEEPKAWQRPPAPSAVEAQAPAPLERQAPTEVVGLSEAKADILKRLTREQSAVQSAQEAVDDALDWREGRLDVSAERRRIQATLREWYEECDRNIKVFNRANGIDEDR